MLNLDISPTVPQILGHQAPMTMMRFILTTEQAGIVLLLVIVFFIGVGDPFLLRGVGIVFQFLGLPEQVFFNSQLLA